MIPDFASLADSDQILGLLVKSHRLIQQMDLRLDRIQ